MSPIAIPFGTGPGGLRCRPPTWHILPAWWQNCFHESPMTALDRLDGWVRVSWACLLEADSRQVQARPRIACSSVRFGSLGLPDEQRRRFAVGLLPSGKDIWLDPAGLASLRESIFLALAQQLREIRQQCAGWASATVEFPKTKFFTDELDWQRSTEVAVNMYFCWCNTEDLQVARRSAFAFTS